MQTRIAPTPSGYLHTGNVCSFLLTQRLANRYNGSILLRIDDLDGSRVRQEYVNDIFETLEFFNIAYQKGPRNLPEFEGIFSQHRRLPVYEQLLNELCDTGLVYACTCSRKKLAETTLFCNCRKKKIPLDDPDAAWRIHVPDETIISLKDEKSGIIKIDLATAMPDFVIRKKDRLPSYQVASLADDLHYGIDYIVRGEDLLPSTAAQIYLATITRKDVFLKSRVYHHPLLTDSDGVKFSKSAGSISVKSLCSSETSLKWLEALIQDW